MTLEADWRALFVFWLACMPVVSIAAAPTNGDVNQLAKTLFKARQFQSLEELAASYRKQHTMTQEGFLALYQLYSGITILCREDSADSHWASIEQTSADWLAHYPKSSTANLAAATAYMCHAELQRGDDWAQNTSPEQMRKFIATTGIARSILDGHKDIASIDPWWFKLRIDAANYLGEEKRSILTYAKRGVDLEPQMYAIYYSAMRGLSPRWGGSAGFMDKLIKLGDSHTSADVGDQFYGRVTYVLINDLGVSELQSERMDLHRAQASFEVIITKYPAVKNYNYAAAVSCVARDSAALGHYLVLIGSGLDESAWFGNRKFMNECVTWGRKS